MGCIITLAAKNGRKIVMCQTHFFREWTLSCGQGAIDLDSATSGLTATLKLSGGNALRVGCHHAEASRRLKEAKEEVKL
jgi:hypothetical protein